MNYLILSSVLFIKKNTAVLSYGQTLRAKPELNLIIKGSDRSSQLVVERLTNNHSNFLGKLYVSTK